jgi:hypothetical protein
MVHDARRAPDRDVLWVIALRAKLLHAQAGKQLEAARLHEARTRATVVRVAALVEACQRNHPALNVRRARVVPLVRRPRRP